jgi:hypothetical protein
MVSEQRRLSSGSARGTAPPTFALAPPGRVRAMRGRRWEGLTGSTWGRTPGASSRSDTATRLGAAAFLPPPYRCLCASSPFPRPPQWTGLVSQGLAGQRCRWLNLAAIMAQFLTATDTQDTNSGRHAPRVPLWESPTVTPSYRHEQSRAKPQRRDQRRASRPRPT